jgi:hypothetical protein
MIYEVVSIMDLYATSPDQAAKQMKALMDDKRLPIIKVKEHKTGSESVYDTSFDPPKQVA